MSVVKTIDVALRSNTEQWDSGFGKASKSLDSFSAKTNAIAAQMGKAASMLQLGTISQNEYSAAIQRSERELAAVQAGFSGMSSAVAKADSIMRSLETSAERYENELRELNQLLKIGALNQDQYAIASQRVTAAYNAAQPKVAAVQSNLSKLTNTVASNMASQTQFGGVLAGMGTGGLAAAAGIGVAAVAARKLGETTIQAIERMEASADAAERLGILTAEFQKLDYAAKFAGVSSEELSAGLEKMAKNISSATAGGSEKLLSTFKKLNLDAAQLGQMSMDQAFLKVADALDKVQNPANKLRLTMEIFGKSGAGFINIFEGGRDSLEKAGKEAEKFGQTISEFDAEKIKRTADAVDRLGLAWEGLANAMTVRAAPAIENAANNLTDIITNPTSRWNDILRSGASPLGAGLSLLGSTPNMESAQAAITNQAQKTADVAAKLNATDEAADTIDATQQKVEDAWKSQQKTMEDFNNAMLESFEKSAQKTQAAVERLTDWQDDANKTLNPALAFQNEMKTRIGEINELFDRQVITLEKRNELLDTAKRLMLRTERESAFKSNKALEEWLDGSKKLDMAQAQLKQVEPPAAVERGTQAAFSAFQNNRNTVDADTKRQAQQQAQDIQKIRRMFEKNAIVLSAAKL